MFSIQAITLDLDDTLWEITPVIEKAEEKIYRWLSEYCPRATERFSPDDMRQIRIEVLEENPEHSHDLSELRRLAFKKILHAVNYDETWADRAFEQFMVHRNDVELYPDALPALQSMAAAFPLATITNGNADLDKIGIRHHFRATITARDHGIAKPDQAIFLAACRTLQCEPEQVLHIGDSPEHDVLGAANAGMRTVWLNRDGADWPHSRTADLEVSSLNQVIRHLNP